MCRISTHRPLAILILVERKLGRNLHLVADILKCLQHMQQDSRWAMKIDSEIFTQSVNTCHNHSHSHVTTTLITTICLPSHYMCSLLRCLKSTQKNLPRHNQTTDLVYTHIQCLCIFYFKSLRRQEATAAVNYRPLTKIKSPGS